MKRDYEKEQVDLVLRLTIYPLVATRDTLIGTGHVLVQKTRRIVHYNQWDTYSIPFSIGWKTQISRFNVLAGVGVDAIFRKKAKGRTIKQDSFFDYQSSSADYNQNFTLGLSADLTASYRVTDSFSIGLRVRHNRQMVSWSMDSDLGLCPRIT